MSSPKQLISVIVPVFNEEDNVDRAYQAICAEFEKQDNLALEIIFTDNHSTDGTLGRLRAIAMSDTRVRVLRFSRNFGFNRSILTGYRCARGDAAIQIDCDLEDPPSVFREFIRLWRAGHDVVLGIRTRRVERPLIAWARKSFFKVLNSISEFGHEPAAGDFRLVDRRVLDQLKLIGEARPYVRGLISELARNQGTVPYERHRREFGDSKFPVRHLIRLASEGIVAHSTVPLRVSTYVGLTVALFATLVTGFYVFGRIFAMHDWPAGFATTTVLLLFGISLNALFLGIIGEYVARIYEQVRQRPTVVIEEAINIDGAGLSSLEGLPRGL